MYSARAIDEQRLHKTKDDTAQGTITFEVLQRFLQGFRLGHTNAYSIDGNGNVTRHFPESGWTAVKMKHSGSEIPLDFSYELDDAPDFECFILVASKKAFSLEGIDEEIAASSVDVDFIQVGNYLPSGTDRTAFLLRK